jgi:DNA-directed RNA polymerase specialized sigma24 family protein
MTSRTDIVSHPFAANLIRRKAQQLCRRPGFSRSDEDDLTQGMLLYLWTASRLYNPARGNVEAFIVTAVRSWMDMEVRRRRAEMRFTGVPDTSLDSTMVDCGDGDISALVNLIGTADANRHLGREARDLLADLDLREAVARVTSRLSQHELQFMRDVIDGGVAGAARKRHTSRRQILATLTAIRERFTRTRADGESAA